MKYRISIACISLLNFACGGSQSTPASASSQTNQPATMPMNHEQPATMSPAALAEPSPAPAVSSSAAPVATAASSTNNIAKPDAAPGPSSSGASSATTGKGSLSVTVNSTPANAAKNAVVYLEGAPLDRDVTGSLDNRQMAFIPHVLVVTAGAKVTFTNSDPFPHNVFSPDNEKWDMGMIPAHGTRVRKFEKPSVYTVLCNVHPNMKAYIVVVPSSYFAKADKSGNIAIHDVPAGKYKLVTWAPGVKSAEQEVTVDGDKSVSVELHR